MKKNIGICDAYIRLFLGFMIFGIGIIKRSKCTIAMGSMKIAEGITRFCPMLYILNLCTHEENLISHCFHKKKIY
ncbi:YgaP family membrane protein [Defluviitalea phaphyphila]|uniref:YgaP family membrane protein n=1 Tax=Defluviitalea phaphyphila TaxID=1473580 RepID=UPI00072FE861|nr:DUF2892 domain-containing protein [Defluviitalea phaphyphila]